MEEKQHQLFSMEFILKYYKEYNQLLKKNFPVKTGSNHDSCCLQFVDNPL